MRSWTQNTRDVVGGGSMDAVEKKDFVSKIGLF